ncbi:CehA/McbA family metallohydrolase [Candidatus Neomarinimicrobiota bacterium]
MTLLLGIFLYVEIHYRAGYLPSRYYRREPEILADAPRRIEPGLPIPVFLIVKDAHKYPIFLHKVLLVIEYDRGTRSTLEIPLNISIAERWWHHALEVERPDFEGEIGLRIVFHYKRNGIHRTCHVHNIRSLRPAPLNIYLADESLPGENTIWGDLHHHTWFTEDMIEFGAPLDAVAQSAQAMGLDFVAATDHSYDLDDELGEWRKQDHYLTEWHQSREQIIRLNANDKGPVIIPGEEVTIQNAIGRNVHLLVLGNEDYLPGSGDSGEHPLRTKSELRLGSLSTRDSPDIVVIAAHPFQPVSLMQRVLISRDIWKDRDIDNPVLDGLQILNGRIDDGFHTGLDRWIQLLLKGTRKYIYAGSDAHGDFNIHRQIKIPFLSLEECDSNTLGYCRTGVLETQPHSLPDLLSGLKAGRCIISTGPFISISVITPTHKATIGETISGQSIKVVAQMRSSREYGPVARFKLLRGIIGHTSEEVLVELKFSTKKYNAEYSHQLASTSGNYYLRAELHCLRESSPGSIERQDSFAITNPIWVENAVKQ